MRYFELFVAAMIASASSSADAHSQDPAASLSNDATCRVVDIRPDLATDGGAGMLAATCGAHGAPIGPATAFSISAGPSGNLLLVRQFQLKTEVLLISPSSRNTVHIDDLTQGLMRKAGLAPDMAVGQITFDISNFATDSSVQVKAGKTSKRFSLVPYFSKVAPTK